MRKIDDFFPPGILRFSISRIFRSLITLVLFQLVLFGLIQALTATLPYDFQDFAMAVRFREDLSRFGTGGSREDEETPVPTLASTGQPQDDGVAVATEMSNIPGGIAIEMEGPPAEEATPAADPGGEDSGVVEEETPGALTPTPPVEGDGPAVPWWGEFVAWMSGFYRGDLGRSTSLGSTPVIEILKFRLPRTLILLIPGTFGGLALGIWLGKMVAWKPRGWLELAATMGGTAFYTSFPPWLAFVLFSVFGLNLNWFPPEKLINPNKWYMWEITLNEVILRMLITLAAASVAYLLLVWLTRNVRRPKILLWRLAGGIVILILAAAPWVASGLDVLALDVLDHLVLPVSTIILLSFGETLLVMKTAMSEAVGAEYVTAAQARGLPDTQVRDRHAARVAILPVLTRFVVHLPFIIVGSFVVEHLFYWQHGMGVELVRAADELDLPVLMGILSLVAIFILLSHTLLDVLMSWLDPRLRGSGSFRQPAGKEG